MASVSEGNMSKPCDFVQATLDLPHLNILALEPLHGWAIRRRLTAVPGDVLQVSEGSLYPALHMLELEGWLKGEWKPTENNRRARFDSSTPRGRKALKEQSAVWDWLSAAVSQLPGLKEAKG